MSRAAGGTIVWLRMVRKLMGVDETSRSWTLLPVKYKFHINGGAGRPGAVVESWGWGEGVRRGGKRASSQGRNYSVHNESHGRVARIPLLNFIASYERQNKGTFLHKGAQGEQPRTSALLCLCQPPPVTVLRGGGGNIYPRATESAETSGRSRPD